MRFAQRVRFFGPALVSTSLALMVAAFVAPFASLGGSVPAQEGSSAPISNRRWHKPTPTATPTPPQEPAVVITSPVSGSVVSGTVAIVAEVSSAVVSTNFYVDGVFLASGPPYTYSWDSTTVQNGTHVLSATAYADKKTPIGTSAVSVTVNNVVKSPTPTATSTPTVSRSHYVDDSGSPACSDSGDGTSPSAPWCTVAKVASMLASLPPGEQVLFKCGDTWKEQLTIPSGTHGVAGNNIVIGHYGSNCVLPNGTYAAVLPVLDGGSTRAHGIYAAVSSPISYVTIDGFDIHDTTLGGINIVGYRANKPGFVIENNLVHQVGPGACAGCGLPTDNGAYDENAGISFNDDGSGNGLSYSDNTQILNNTVWDIGGHNALRVHYDGGPSMLVDGNTVGPGCIHNCIDTKGINGTVSHNVATCPSSSARGAQCGTGNAAFYSENSAIIAGTHGHWKYNVAFDVPLGFQFQGTRSNAPILYNNTIFGTTQYGLYFGCTDVSGDVRKNLLQGNIAHASSCVSTWDYNDEYESSGGLAGAHDINIDPAYVAPLATPPDFHTQNATVNSIGVGSDVTPEAYLGALGPP